MAINGLNEIEINFFRSILVELSLEIYHFKKKAKRSLNTLILDATKSINRSLVSVHQTDELKFQAKLLYKLRIYIFFYVKTIMCKHNTI